MDTPFTSRMTRLMLVLFLLGGVIWLGGSMLRTVIGYDVFVPGTFEFRTEQSETVRLNTIRLFAFTGIWTAWSFAAMCVGALALMVMLRHLYKRRGWLLMSALLLCLLIPAQGYLISKDYALLQYFDLYTGVPLSKPVEIQAAFSERVSNIANSMTAGLSLLAAISVVTILATRPLHRS